MAIAESPPSDGAVEAAITRVLAAERDARDAVAASQRQAAEIAEQARFRARQIAERTDRRIRAVRAAFQRRVEGEVAMLEREAGQPEMRHEPSVAELARLDHAIQALAKDLTGNNR